MSSAGLHPTNVDRLAKLLVEQLEAEQPDALAQLRQDPLQAVLDWPGVDAQTIDMSAGSSRGDCSVSGYYLETRHPPALRIAKANSVRRMNFTALHELGHHLQPDNLKVAKALRGDGHARRLEDRVCDSFAANILLPDEIDDKFDRLGPTAADVADLFDRTQASRSACCVRAARALVHEGWVILAATDGTVIFAAGAHHQFRLAPGTRQPATTSIASAGRTGARSRGLDPVTYPKGTTSPHFNVDAVERGGYVYAVMSMGATPWAPAPVPKRLQRPGAVHVLCPTPGCGHEWPEWDPPHQRCGQHRCPSCDRCGCRATTGRRLCDGCGLQRSRGDWQDGGDVCDDCA